MGDPSPDERLRTEIEELRAVGLSPEEAAVVAGLRLGRSTDDAAVDGGGARTAVLLAIAAGAIVHLVRLAGDAAGLGDGWLARNAVLLLVPGLVVLLGLRRGVDRRGWLRLGLGLALVTLAANAVPHAAGSDTELLAALHLPVLGWAVVLMAHAGGRVGDASRRIAAVRSSGEVAVLYVLIAIGGGVLLALAGGLIAAVGLDAEPLAEWVLPAGAAGAVVIAGWLVEARPRLAAGVVPALAQVFTPLFGAMIAVVLVTYVALRPDGFDRDVVVLMDLLMVVVLGLAVYGQAARPPDRAAGWDDRLRLAAVALALVLDLGVLGAMLARVGELGTTPNRIAALGLNVVLLVALTGSATTLGRALRGRIAMAAVERWQARAVLLLIAWAAFVAVVLPVLPLAAT